MTNLETFKQNLDIHIDHYNASYQFCTICYQKTLLYPQDSENLRELLLTGHSLISVDTYNFRFYRLDWPTIERNIKLLVQSSRLTQADLEDVYLPSQLLGLIFRPNVNKLLKPGDRL